MKTEQEQRAYLQGVQDRRDGWIYNRADELYDDPDLKGAYDLGYDGESAETEYLDYLIED